ncbi:MAG: thiamine-phosphate kinase [Candidatus Acidiferrales bacterium]
MDSESQLVERTARAIASSGGRRGDAILRLGIGDDAAILAPRGRSEWVLSCDAFLEGVHFLAKVHPPESVGYKALVRAASDLVAMGASPRFFLLTLAVPSRLTGAWFDAFLRGMARAARLLDIRLAGGDTTKSDSVFISVTVLGEVPRGMAIQRGGARPGDIIYVSGRLGRAQLGLELILNRLGGGRGTRRLLQPHLYPRIRVELGEWLARHRIASAMMDVSDGLSTDLIRLCHASRTGARVWADRISRVVIPASISKRLRKLKLNPLMMALDGGEDYELLFTVSPRKAKRLQRAPGFGDLTPIGEITAKRGIFLVSKDGASKPLRPGGWDSFTR